jgi:predicted MFS family arabinose efflux permease
VVANLAVAIGPAIGGILAGISYTLLFILDAVASSITAVIVFKAIPETKPEKKDDQPSESILQTVKGYGLVSKDGLFMAYIIATMVVIVVYSQMYSTLSVYLNQFHGVSSQGFGYLMSMNAAMVVIMQFWITKRIKNFPPMVMMMIASALYGIGYLMFAFVDQYVFFIIAMATITIGEMLHVPVAQTLVSFFAPDDMRGRYMAAYGLGWVLPNTFAPLLAGLIMDNYDPELVWYWAGLLSLIAIIAFGFLRKPTKERFGS